MSCGTLKKLGYHLNTEILRQEFLQGTGEHLTEQEQHFFCGMAPYMVMAYQQGLSQRALTDVFCFLEPVKTGEQEENQ